MDPKAVGGAVLILIAVAHSGLGEARILRPLVSLGGLPGVSAQVSGRILRMAWHATSLAWVGLAMVLFGASHSAAMLVAAGLPALFSVAVVRTHLAWPLFLLALFVVLRAEGNLSDSALAVGGSAAIAIAVVAAAVHLYWASGGRWGQSTAVPSQRDDSGDVPVFRPPRLATAGVGLLLAIYGGALGLLLAGGAPSPARWLVAAGVVVLALRAIGDGRYVGFTKRIRGTAFASADDRWFTPLVVALAFGSAAALFA